RRAHAADDDRAHAAADRREPLADGLRRRLDVRRRSSGPGPDLPRAGAALWRESWGCERPGRAQDVAGLFARRAVRTVFGTNDLISGECAMTTATADEEAKYIQRGIPV